MMKIQIITSRSFVFIEAFLSGAAVILFGLLAPITTYAGWTCPEIKTGRQTIGSFGSFMSTSSNLSYQVYILFLVLIPLCLSIIWAGLSLRKLRHELSVKKTTQRVNSKLSIIASGATTLLFGYVFINTLGALLNVAAFNPTWTDYNDTIGSSCSIMTYTLNQKARLTLVLIIIVVITLLIVVITKQVAKQKKN